MKKHSKPTRGNMGYKIKILIYIGVIFLSFNSAPYAALTFSGSSGGSINSSTTTYCGYYSDATTISGDAGCTYNSSTDVMTLTGGLVSSGSGTFGGTSQSTFREGLIVNNDAGTDEDDDFKVNVTGGVVAIEVDAGDGTFTSALTGSLGWAPHNAANTACNTTCVSACVVGLDSASSTFLTCADATADSCLCAGPT